MASMDLRVRALGWALRHLPGSSITTMDRERLVRAQQRQLEHNPVLDLVFGGIAPGVDLTDRALPGPAGQIPFRVYRPASDGSAALPLVVNYHGGGWVSGTLNQSDWICSMVSATVGAVVLSVDYRLAPVHPFPAAVQDCYAALVWAADNATELGADADRIGVMGDSAGGNLAAATSLVARERHGPRIAHQALLYPATDLTLSSRAMGDNAAKPVLSVEDMLAFCRLYLGGHDGAARDPHASPLLADDHRDLPPALIQVAEHDPLRDDGIRYADALRAAGVPVRLTEYVGMPHGYLSFPRICRCAPQALAELCAEQVGALCSR